MKVKPYRICDICKKEIADKNTWDRVVIKQRFWSRNYIGYDRIDLCPKCQEKMFDWIRNERRK